MGNPKEIKFEDYDKITEKIGSNQGGFFKNKKDRKLYYIKWMQADLNENEKKFFDSKALAKGKYKNRHRNRFANEILALRIYELYNTPVPKAELITFTDEKGIQHYGIASEKQDDITKFKDLKSNNLKVASRKAQEHFLIDVLLSNYDVVGLEKDNMFFNEKRREVFRLDPGAALKYYAQGKAKKNEFNSEVIEFEEMISGKQIKTQFHPGALKTCSDVFHDIYDSPALLVSLKKLISVSDEKLKECIIANGFDFNEMDSNGRNKGKDKNEALIDTLLQRKGKLIQKAEDKIIERLVNGLTTDKARRAYLREAGISNKEVWAICDAIKKNQDMREKIKQAIEPDNFYAKKDSGIKEIMDNESFYFNKIIEENLLSKAPGDSDAYHSIYKNNNDQRPIQRVNHGGMHASRTALHSEVIVSLLREAGYLPALKLTPKDLFLIKIAALFHDAGRAKDSASDKAEWERAGANMCQEWLEEHGFSKDDIDKAVEAISHKDDKKVQKKNTIALILAASDSLDWVRSHSSNFETKYMPDIIKTHLSEERLTTCATIAKKIAIAQGDSPRDDLGQTGNFDISTKKTYEHSDTGCYTETQKIYLQYKNEFKLNPQISDNAIYVKGELFKALHIEGSYDKFINFTATCCVKKDPVSLKASYDALKNLNQACTKKSMNQEQKNEYDKFIKNSLQVLKNMATQAMVQQTHYRTFGGLKSAETTSFEKSRHHLWYATVENSDKLTAEFKEKYMSFKGDHLKSKLLNELKEEINQINSLDQLKSFEKGLKERDEYKLLSKSQGVMTHILGLKTSSLKALETMIDEKRNILEISNNITQDKPFVG